jgi:hypothetical protein
LGERRDQGIVSLRFVGIAFSQSSFELKVAIEVSRKHKMSLPEIFQSSGTMLTDAYVLFVPHG